VTLADLIEYAWDSEALCLFQEGAGLPLHCIDRVIARYLFDGDKRPLIDALVRSRHVPAPDILRLIGEMHEPSSRTTPEMLPFKFLTFDRDTSKEIIKPADRAVYLWSDALLLEDLKVGDDRSLARMFKAGKYPSWPILLYYAAMHDEQASTPYCFVIKHRGGKPGARPDPEMDHANWLAAGNVELLKRRKRMKHELACRKIAQWMSVEQLKSDGYTHVAALREVVRRTSDSGVDQKEEWVRKASRKYGAHWRNALKGAADLPT
jgi:hypothetical protein